MIRLILIFSLFTGSYTFATTFQVVSDFDDTIKVTNVGSRKAAVCSTLLNSKVFTGIAPLFQKFKAKGAPVSLVSGGVIHWQFLMYDDLHKNNIPYDQIFMKGFLSESTLPFKYSKLVQLLSKHRLPMVLIGDDTQYDPDAYSQFRHEYPNYFLASYIRNVTGRPLPPHMRRFYTPYEIAVYEHLDGRLGFHDVEDVAQSILTTADRKTLFPHFVNCPKTEADLIGLIDISHDRSKLALLTRQVTAHLINLCNQR